MNLSPNAIGLFLALVGLALLLRHKKKAALPYLKSLWVSSFVFFCIYAALLLFVMLKWKYLEMQLDSFDINENGFIDLEEYTGDYRAINEKYYRDTARNFAFLTAAIFSFLIAVVVLLIAIVLYKLRLSVKK